MIAKDADTKGNYILKFVELEIEDFLGTVKTLCTFKLDKKPRNHKDTFVYCKKLDAVISYTGSLAIYTKPEDDDDCWVKGEAGDSKGIENLFNKTKTPCNIFSPDGNYALGCHGPDDFRFYKIDEESKKFVHRLSFDDVDRD